MTESLDTAKAEAAKDINLLRLEADDALSSENFEAAIQAYEMIVGLQPEDKKSALQLKKAQTKLAAAEEMLQKKLREEEEEAAQKAELAALVAKYRDEANAAMGTDDYESAIKAFTAAWELDPSDKKLSLALKRAEKELKQQQELEALKANAVQAEELAAKGKDAMDSEDYSAAVQFFKAATELSPDDKKLGLSLKRAEQRLQQQKDAEERRARAEAREKERLAREEERQAAAAAKAAVAEKMARIDKQKLVAKERGDMAAADGDHVKALAIFSAAHELDSTSSSPGGKKLLMSMKKSQAKVAVQNTAAATAAGKKGEHLRESKDFEGAIAAFERGLKIEVKDSRIMDNLTAGLEKTQVDWEVEVKHLFHDGQEAFDRNDYDEAASNLDQCLQLKPRDVELAQKAQSMMDTAQKALEEQDGSLKEAHAKLDEGQQAFDRQDYVTAIAAYEAGLDLQVEQKLLIKRLQRGLEKAREAREQELKCHEKARNMLEAGQQCMLDDNLPDALQLFTEGVAMAAGDTELEKSLESALEELLQTIASRVQRLKTDADGLMANDDPKAAVALLTEAIKLAPDDKRLALSLKKAQNATGKQILPQFKALLMQGDTKGIDYKYDEALAMYNEALKLAVDDPELQTQAQGKIDSVPGTAAAYLYGQVSAAEKLFAAGVFARARKSYEEVLNHAFVNDTIRAMLKQKSSDAEPKFAELLEAKAFLQAYEVHQLVTVLNPENDAFKQQAQKMTKNMRPVGDQAFKADDFDTAVGAYTLGLAYSPDDKRLSLALKKAEKKKMEEDVVGAKVLNLRFQKGAQLLSARKLGYATELFKEVMRSKFADTRLEAGAPTVYELVQNMIESNVIRFSDLIVAGDYLLAFETYQMVEKLAPGHQKLKKRAQDQTKVEDMRPAAEQALHANEFDMAVGAYKLGLLYNLSDKRLSLALKKAEKMKLKVDAAGAKELNAKYDEGVKHLEASEFKKATALFTEVMQSKYSDFRVHKSQSTAFENVQTMIDQTAAQFEEVFGAEAYMQAIAIHEMITTLSPDDQAFKEQVQEMTKNMRPVGDAAAKEHRWEVAVGAYKLGLLYNDRDKRLALALKQVDGKYSEISVKEVMNVLITELEVQEAKETFPVAFGKKDYMAASDSYTFVLENASTQDPSFTNNVEYYLKSRDMQTEGEHCFRDWKYEASVGAYRLALIQKPGDKKLALALKKAMAKVKSVAEDRSVRNENEAKTAAANLPKWKREGDYILPHRLSIATELYSKVIQNAHCDEAMRQAIEHACELQLPRFDELIAQTDYMQALEVHNFVTTLVPDNDFRKKVQATTSDFRAVGDAAMAESNFETAVGAYKLGLLYRDGDKRLMLALKKGEGKLKQVLDTRMAKAAELYQSEQIDEAVKIWSSVQRHERTSEGLLQVISDKCDEAVVAFNQKFTAKDYLRSLSLHHMVIVLAPENEAFKQSVEERMTDILQRGDTAMRQSKFERATAAYKLGLVYNPRDKHLMLALKKAKTKIETQQQLAEQIKLSKQVEARPALDAIMEEAAESYAKNRFGYAGMKWASVMTHAHVDEELLQEISNRCTEVIALYDNAFGSENFLQALEMHNLATTLAPEDEAFKQRVQETTKDMRSVGDKAFKAEKFETAVGAYKLGLLYNRGDKKIALMLKKAEAKLKATQKDRSEERSEATVAFFERLEAEEHVQVWANYQVAVIDNFGAEDSAFKRRAQKALREFEKNVVDFRSIAEDATDETDLEKAIACYNLALTLHEGNKKLSLSLKKVEKARSAAEAKERQQIEDMVCRDVVEWLIVNTTRLDLVTMIGEAMESQEFIRALELRAEFITKYGDDDVYFLEQFEEHTEGIEAKGDAAVEDAEWATAVGAFRIAILISGENVNLMKKLAGAEEKYAVQVKAERQEILDHEIVAKLGTMRLEIEGLNSGRWATRLFRLIAGGVCHIYDAEEVKRVGLAEAKILKTLQCSTCDVEMTSHPRDDAPFCFKICVYKPGKDGIHLDLAETMVIEPSPSSEDERTSWMQNFAHPPPALAPDTPTDEEAEVKCGWNQLYKKSKLRGAKPADQWFRLMTGGSLYLCSDDKHGSKVNQTFQCNACVVELPKGATDAAPFVFNMKHVKETFVVESKTLEERDGWMELIRSPPPRTVGTNHLLKLTRHRKLCEDGDNAFLVSRDLNAAIDAYRKALDIYPDDVHAKRLLQDVMDKVSEKKVAADKLQQGNDALEKEESAAALQLFTEAFILDPSNKKIQLSIRKAEKAIAGSIVQQAESCLNKGNAALKKGDPIKALALFHEGVELDPSNKKLRLAVKKVAKQAAKYEEQLAVAAENRRLADVEEAEAAAIAAEEAEIVAQENAEQKKAAAISEQEAAIDSLESNLEHLEIDDDELLWPFTNLVKVTWMRVESGKSKSGQWERKFFKLHAGGTVEIYESDTDGAELQNSFECKMCHTVGIPKTARKDAPYAFRIDWEIREKNGNRLPDGKLIVEPDTTAHKEHTRDDWIKLIKDTPAKIEDGPELDAAIAEKRAARKAALLEKRRSLANQRKQAAVEKEEYEKRTQERRNQLAAEQAAKDAAAKEKLRRSELAQSDGELDSLEDQRGQREWLLGEGDRMAAAHQYDDALEQWERGLKVDLDDPDLEFEVINGWFRTMDAKQSGSKWQREYLRLVAGGVIYGHSDDSSEHAKRQRQQDLADEYLVKEGFMMVESAKKGKKRAWDQKWFRMMSGGALLLYDADPNPPPEEALLMLKSGPVRVRRYADQSLNTQVSEWEPAFWELMGDGRVNVRLDNPNLSVYQEDPMGARVISSFQLSECKVGLPEGKDIKKQLLKAKSVPFQVDKPDESMLVESIERLPSSKKLRDAWTTAIIPLSMRVPPKPYLRLGYDEYKVGPLKNQRKDTPHAFRIDGQIGEAEHKVVANPSSGKLKAEWMRLFKRPPPIRVKQVRAEPLQVQRYIDETLVSSMGEYEAHFIRLTSDGMIRIHEDDPTKHRYRDLPEAEKPSKLAEVHYTAITAGLPVKAEKKVQKELSKSHPYVFQVDLQEETLLLNTASTADRDEWIKLLNDPLANPFELEPQPEFAPTTENLLRKLRCRRFEVVMDRKAPGAGAGTFLLNNSDVKLYLDPQPTLIVERKKWMQQIAECPVKEGCYLDDEFKARIAKVPEQKEAYAKLLEAQAHKKELDRQQAKQEAHEKWEEEQVRDRLPDAIATAVEQDTKLNELEERKAERQRRKDELEEKKKQREIDRLLQEEAKAEEKRIKEEKAAMGKAEVARKKEEARLKREQWEQEQEEKRQALELHRDAEVERTKLYHEHRNMYDPKYYCGWLKIKATVGGNTASSVQMWAVVNDGVLQCWKESENINLNWVWEMKKPRLSMALIGIKKLRAFHDEGEVIQSKPIKDTGFMITDTTQEWYVNTNDAADAERWVKWLSVTRLIVACRTGMSWKIADPKTLQIQYKFYTDAERGILNQRQADEDKREEEERKRGEEEEKKRREELVEANKEMLDVKNKEATEQRLKAEAQAKIAKRANFKEQDKIVYSYPPEHEFDLKVQPFAILIPALPIIRAKAGWIMHKSGEMEVIPGKKELKMVVKMRRTFAVMWRHPQADSGHYDILKYETDDDHSNDGPIEIIKLRGRQVSATEEPTKQMPGRFVVRIKHKAKKQGKMTEHIDEHEFDASSKASAHSWVDFILYGPDFSIDFDSKVDEELRAKQAAIDRQMREEAVAERGRRAKADLLRRHDDDAQEEDEPDSVFDPAEDRVRAKELQAEAKLAQKEADYHLKTGKAAERRGQIVAYEDQMRARDSALQKADGLRAEAESMLARAKETEKMAKAAANAKPAKKTKEQLKAEKEMAAALEEERLEEEVQRLEEEAEEENVLYGMDEDDDSMGMGGDEDDAGTGIGGLSLESPQPASSKKLSKLNNAILETWNVSRDEEVVNPLADIDFDDVQLLEEEKRFTIVEDGLQSRGLMNKAKKVGNTADKVVKIVDAKIPKDDKKKKKKKKKKK
eukprot:SAG11_NODE_107_length_16392_cov_18.393666_2_plen_3990_part_00